VKTCFRIFSSLLGAILVLSGSAHAEYIYTFTGQDFLGRPPSSIGVATGIYSLTDHITGTMSVDDMTTLEPRTSAGGPAEWLYTPPTAYSFTDGHQTLTEQNSTLALFRVFMGDSLANRPLEWWIEMTTPTSGLQTIGFGDNGDRAWLDDSEAHHFLSQGQTRWTVEHIVPEPSTLALVGAGLVALGIGLWRRMRAT